MLKNIDYKQIFSYMTTIAKIISFISLVLSVVVKIKMLVASSNIKNEDDKKDDDEKSEVTNDEN